MPCDLEEPESLEDRARGFLRNPDWNEMLEDAACEGMELADELRGADEERLREVAEHIRRAADGAAIARAAIRVADRALLGGAGAS